LLILVRNSGHALRKEDLIEQVWPDSCVEESNLNHYISLLRKALGDSGKGDEYVETVRGYGFRFKAEVRRANEEQSSVLVHRHTRTHLVVKQEESESRSTVRSDQRTIGTATKAVAILALAISIGGSIVAYFAAIRPARLRRANEARSLASTGSTKTAEKPSAREAYLRGRYFWNKRNHDDILKAEREFQNALEIDPNFAPAFAGLADCLLMGGAIPAFPDSAKGLALKALSIDDRLAEAHASLAYYQSAVEWNWAEAELEFQRAISLDPEYATARHWHAYNLVSLGRLDEALSEIKTAESLDPVSVIIKTDVGHILYFARRYDEAATQYLKALAVDPNFRVAHWRLGEAYIQMKRHEEASAELQKAISLDSAKDSEIYVWLACALAAANQRQEAMQILNRRKPDAELYHQTYSIALVYSALGDKDSAFAWLEKSVGFREGLLALIKVEPLLENLRGDPRYANLLRRVNLS